MGLEIWKWRPRSGQNLEIAHFGRAAAEKFGNELSNHATFGNTGYLSEFDILGVEAISGTYRGVVGSPQKFGNGDLVTMKIWK